MSIDPKTAIQAYADPSIWARLRHCLTPEETLKQAAIEAVNAKENKIPVDLLIKLYDKLAKINDAGRAIVAEKILVGFARQLNDPSGPEGKLKPLVKKVNQFFKKHHNDAIIIVKATSAWNNNQNLRAAFFFDHPELKSQINNTLLTPFVQARIDEMKISSWFGFRLSDYFSIDQQKMLSSEQAVMVINKLAEYGKYDAIREFLSNQSDLGEIYLNYLNEKKPNLTLLNLIQILAIERSEKGEVDALIKIANYLNLNTNQKFDRFRASFNRSAAPIFYENRAKLSKLPNEVIRLVVNEAIKREKFLDEDMLRLANSYHRTGTLIGDELDKLPINIYLKHFFPNVYKKMESCISIQTDQLFLWNAYHFISLQEGFDNFAKGDNIEIRNLTPEEQGLLSLEAAVKLIQRDDSVIVLEKSIFNRDLSEQDLKDICKALSEENQPMFLEAFQKHIEEYKSNKLMKAALEIDWLKPAVVNWLAKRWPELPKVQIEKALARIGNFKEQEALAKLRLELKIASIEEAAGSLKQEVDRGDQRQIKFLNKTVFSIVKSLSADEIKTLSFDQLSRLVKSLLLVSRGKEAILFLFEKLTDGRKLFLRILIRQLQNNHKTICNELLKQLPAIPAAELRLLGGINEANFSLQLLENRTELAETIITILKSDSDFEIDQKEFLWNILITFCRNELADHMFVAPRSVATGNFVIPWYFVPFFMKPSGEVNLELLQEVTKYPGTIHQFTLQKPP